MSFNNVAAHVDFNNLHWYDTTVHLLQSCVYSVCKYLITRIFVTSINEGITCLKMMSIVETYSSNIRHYILKLWRCNTNNNSLNCYGSRRIIYCHVQGAHLWNLPCKRRIQSASSYPISLKKKTVIRKQTMPTERPPLVGEVSATFCG
jgi:hypothetical protein